jgi:acetyl-CoA carboxylase carboxyl transferase subunit beta
MAWWSRSKKLPPEPKKSVPKGIWAKCEACAATLYERELVESYQVCPQCGHHRRLSTDARMQLILDEGSFQLADDGLESADPLEFRVDSNRYRDRLKAAAKTHGGGDAYRAGAATIGGWPVEVGFFVFEYMGGSMGSVVGEKIARQFERALEARRPAIVFSASGGARMQEGALSLMQMAKTTMALEALAERRLPCITVLSDPTTGGVTASFATLGDLVIAEPGALICFAGPRVIQQTIKQDLPEGFQRAEFLLRKGMLDDVVPRGEMKARLATYVRLLRGAPAPPEPESLDAETLERVRAAAV